MEKPKTRREEIIRKLEEKFGGKWEFDKNVHAHPSKDGMRLPDIEGVEYAYPRLMHWRNQGIEAQSMNAYEEDGDTHVPGLVGIYRKVEA